MINEQTQQWLRDNFFPTLPEKYTKGYEFCFSEPTPENEDTFFNIAYKKDLEHGLQPYEAAVVSAFKFEKQNYRGKKLTMYSFGHDVYYPGSFDEPPSGDFIESGYMSRDATQVVMMACYHYITRHILDEQDAIAEAEAEKKDRELQERLEIHRLVDLKQMGRDCTEADSAKIKGWLRDMLIQPGTGQVRLVGEIQEHFPQEYAEAMDEIKEDLTLPD